MSFIMPISATFPIEFYICVKSATILYKKFQIKAVFKKGAKNLELHEIYRKIAHAFTK